MIKRQQWLRIKISRLFLVSIMLSGSALKAYQQLNIQKIDITTLALQKYYKGLEQAAAGNIDQARQNLNFCLQVVPDHINAQIFYRVLQDYTQDNIDEFLVEEIFDIHLDDRDFLNQERIEALGDLIRKNEEYYLLYNLRAQQFLLQRQPYEALADLKQSIRLDSTVYTSYYQAAVLFNSQNRHEEALDHFLTTIRLNPEFGPAYFQAGKIFNRLKQFDEAVRIFESAMQYWPPATKKQEVYEALNNRGTIYLQQKMYDVALADFNRAIELNNSWQESYLNKGIALRELGQYEGALEAFSTVINLNDQHDRAYYQCGLVYMDQEKYEEAKKDIAIAQALNPEENKYLYSLAECYFRSKEYELAVSAYEKLLALDSSYYWAHYWLAFSYEKLKKFNDAIEAYQDFVNKAPEEDYKHRLYATERIIRLKKWLNR